jgi:hypothetical protein
MSFIIIVITTPSLKAKFMPSRVRTATSDSVDGTSATAGSPKHSHAPSASSPSAASQPGQNVAAADPKPTKAEKKA